ncbi:MAG: penicillin-binding transpeptidase domain-containing protein, partial [Chloroflexota bacterium]|nr:penicillin-binding transpeptidase domain-containing protein [Chloroflexota bacterium]
SSIPGIYRDEKAGRIYPHGGIAPHVVGWVAPVPAEQLDAYRARGYRGDEWVGVSGLEAWGEEILAGRHGGALNVVTVAGEVAATVAERQATPSRAIYTTIDRDLQEQVQHILGGRKGAIVVLDAHTGAVLALASGPGFDSNAFVGPAGAADRSQILADPRRLLFNRATQGTYPSASVFKIVTISAALEEAGMHPEHTIFYCPGYWEGLGPASRKGCWKEDGHGDISLKDGLTASCDVTFYSVGQTLDGVGQDVLPRFGRGFGFGEKTGLEGVLEEGGLMPDPDWKANVIGENWWVGDTVNIAIGQGYLLVTPLQVARMIAAVGNGGALYRPYVIQSIGPAGEALPEQATQPEVVGTLPVSAEHLAAIQEALLGVTTKSIGTAPHRFAGLSIPVAGKTGTAEVGGPDTEPHSWFAAYAPADNPEIAIVVLAENAGEGSTVAAPLTRQVVEAYYGLPLSPLPPQAEEDYVPPTPTPQP